MAKEVYGTGITQKRAGGYTWRGDKHGEGTETEREQTRRGDILRIWNIPTSGDSNKGMTKMVSIDDERNDERNDEFGGTVAGTCN